ncbi:CehA/McbA family metallohydrolase [Roseibium sp. Sym1]|uniref:CehA/McbA family metallohydrolase n=1 Tax=Roseibium sp. Sym1 TaxID=3016006 RepID=UPI0022B342F0|nr:CehA/McbA family metallohydrolase [Roseibium sp. Sym1]
MLETGIWLKGDWHMHSRHSTDSTHHGIARIIASARGAGLDYLAITDHDVHVAGAVADHTWADPDFRSDQLTLFYGAELTAARGHANILSARPYDHQRVFDARDARDWDIRALKTELGVHFSANHPDTRNIYSFSWDLADSIEIWNTSQWARNVTGLRIWDDVLLSGRIMPARGGSDAHHGVPENGDMDRPESVEALGNAPGTPTTWVFAQDRSPEAILAALEAGRTSVSANPYAPRAELIVTNRDGTLFMGDIAPASGGSVTVRVTLSGGRIEEARYRVRIICNRKEVALLWTDPVTGAAEATLSLEPGIRAYLRAEIEGPQTPFPPAPYCTSQSGTMVALTGPVYFGYDPAF